MQGFAGNKTFIALLEAAPSKGGSQIGRHLITLRPGGGGP
jgi:hypothetical protein